MYFTFGGLGRVGFRGPGRRLLLEGETFGEIFQTLSANMVVYTSVDTSLCSLFFFVPFHYDGSLLLLRDD